MATQSDKTGKKHGKNCFFVEKYVFFDFVPSQNVDFAP